LEIILRENDYDKAFNYVKQIILDLRAHKVPVKKLAIHTKLQKYIDEYDNIGPHVAAAKLMKEKGFNVEPGMIMRYIICKNKSKKIRDKVKLVEDTHTEDYDPEYYINNQIIPSVDRIFAAIGKDKEELYSMGKQSKLGSFF